METNIIEGLSKEVIDKGVGAVEYQVASLTLRIKNVANHNTENKKDFSAKYGLVKMVSKRSKLLKYLKRKSQDRYKAIISLLGLRK